MKKDMDTIPVRLDRELVYLQFSQEHPEEPGRDVWNEKLHEHMVYEVHLVLRGRININVEGQHYCIRAGEAMVIAPRQHHGNHAGGEIRHVSFFFLPDERAAAMDTALRDSVPGCRVFPATADMLETAGAILREWGEGRPYQAGKCGALLTALLIDTFRALELPRAEQQSKEGELSRMFLCDGYFSGGARDKSAAELAALLHVSERQMNRCLQEYYGMNFRQKLVSARMDCAAWLLCTSGRSVEEIVPIVGYGSESGFFKAFRRRYGMTPLEYRARYQVRRRPPVSAAALPGPEGRAYYRIKRP